MKRNQYEKTAARAMAAKGTKNHSLANNIQLNISGIKVQSVFSTKKLNLEKSFLQQTD